MDSNTPPAPASKKMLWTGRILSALPALMFLASAATKLLQPKGIPEAFEKLGWPMSTVFGLGILQIVCVAIYLTPRTAILGAILLTGYMGGAIAVCVRVGESYIMQFLLGVMLWGGLYLRDARLRALIPFTRP
jgi:hypothetical protein